MIRVPSANSLMTLKGAKAAIASGAVTDASTLLTATATIVASSAAIADPAHSTMALVTSVASMIGASAALVNSTAAIAGRAQDFETKLIELKASDAPGVRLDGECLETVMAQRGLRRLDLRVLYGVAGIGDSAWDGPGADGVFVDGVPLETYLAVRTAVGLDVKVVGRGSFARLTSP